MKRVYPKKHLGQHFLKDELLAKRIVESLEDKIGRVVEIGPGMGVLTQYMLDYHLTAYDVDEASVAYLKETYPLHREKFVYGDFLSQDFDESSLSIIGNFPYNISSQIFFKVYDMRDQVREVVGMVQKEVADRIAAPHGNRTYGILSVLLQAFFDIEKLFVVEPNKFHPPPKVLSTVLRLRRNGIQRLDCDEELFRRIVKMAFGKRRKTLRNALKELNLSPQVNREEVLDLRAEQLDVQQFTALTRLVSTSWK